MNKRLCPVFIACAWSAAILAPATADSEDDILRFCLRGEFDLGVRLQGMHADRNEWYPGDWCVISEPGSGRVQFQASGHSNPDLSGHFAVSYFPPDSVRIVNRDSPPDLDFTNVSISAEALRYRRVDPLRLVDELAANPHRVVATSDDGWQTVRYPDEPVDVKLRITGRRLHALHTVAALPLRGRVPVEWQWDWSDVDAPFLTLSVDGATIFKARGTWDRLDSGEAEAVWQPSGSEAPRQVTNGAWPASIDMRLEQLAENAYLVLGVRTGFHHLVIDTPRGLVVGDAPAGWVEVAQVPPADLVPGLGVSGLSERFIDFLAREFPGRPLRAVVLTHAHDDHAGGARAFAAAGADVYAPAEVSGFLQEALNRDAMPPDRLSEAGYEVKIRPVSGGVSLEGDVPVKLLHIGPGPHVSASLGLLAVDQGLFFQSDLHVPNSEADTPRADRLATECWFARWAVEHLPPGTVVLGSHGTRRSPVSRLANYVDSKECRALG